jgi:PAS domain S-box-containing protein
LSGGFEAWRRRSRRSLVLVVLLSVAPALLLWWCAVAYFGRSFEEQARHRLEGLLEAQAQRLAADLESRAGWLREACGREEVRSALQAWDGRAQGESAERLGAALDAARAGGAPFAAVFAGRGLEAPVVAGKGAPGELAWTTRDLPTGRRSRQAMRLVADMEDDSARRFALAVPGPGPEGTWVGGVLEGRELEEVLRAAGGRAAVVFLARRDGAQVGQPAEGEAERLGEVRDDLRRRGGWVRGRDGAGGAVYRRIEWMPAGIDLALVAETPASEVYAGLRGFHAVVSLVALLALGLGALGVAVALRAVSRPVERLERALEVVSSGGLPPPPSGSDPEAGLADDLLSGLRPERQNAERWKRRAERLEAVAGRLADVALVGCGRDGRIRSLSAGAARLSGWGEGALTGEPLRVLLEPADWERLAARLFGAGPEAGEVRERVQVRRRSGESIPAELRVVPLEDPGEEGFLIVLREVAPRTEAETVLAASEARLRSLVEGISDGVAILRGERLEYANPSLARLLGKAADEISGRPLTDFVAARDLLPVLEAVRAAGRGEPVRDSLSVEVRPAGEGGARQVLLSFAGGAEPGCAVVTLRDVTDLARAERALELERRRLDLTLESTSDGILAVQYHPGGSAVILANRRLQEVFRLPAADLDETSGRVLWERLGRALGAGESWSGRAALFEAPSDTAFTERMEIAGQPPRALEVFCGPIRSGGGRVVGRVATFRDITDQKRMERALHDRSEELASSRGELERAYRELELINQDLERRTQELTRLNRELKSLDEMKSGLLANVSHELQTPLVSVKGYTEMILKEKLGPLTEQQQRGLDVSLKNINRLIGLIDNLLSFSRMEGEMAELRLEAFPLRPLVEEVVETLRSRARERRVEIILAPAGEDLLVRADRDKISQVFLNLLSNAIKFNREGGKVWVEAEAGRRGYVKVEIRDTGIGIPREALDKIFERFYQVDASASRRHEGTGIGLSIVKNILRMHGCMIRADSVLGEGSVFSFTLPAARRARPERSVPKSEPEEAHGGSEERERTRPSRPLGEEPSR